MRLGLIGFGNIAESLLDLLSAEGIVPAHLAVLTQEGSVPAVQGALKGAQAAVAPAFDVVTDAAGLLAARCDLVVECAGHGAVTAHVAQVLRAGTDVVLVSIGSLADDALAAGLKDAATAGGARLVLPAGAVGGIDLLSAIGTMGDITVAYRGTKPPRAWAGTLAQDLLDLENLSAAEVFFEGNARRAAAEYPKNANVAATLALAGAGFEKTTVSLCADPAAPGNIHDYTVTSPLATYSMRIENAPSAGNAKTSQTTVYSVLREIRNRIGPVAI